MAILEVRNIVKNFDKLKVLKDISFDVEQGQVVAIIGPSGSGKSTLLRCINQLERADGGEITVDGTRMFYTDKEKGRVVYASKKELREIRLKIGLVFQNFNLFPHQSVMKNITGAPIHVLKMPKDEARKKADELLEKMGLVGKENSYPCELSGGQQQRVSIARALALNPKILFFDEPTSALDPELTGEILKVIKELAKEKMTMVIVTHEMAFARDVANHVIFMDDGYIVEEGSPEELFGNTQNERTKQFLARFKN
ncbi:amino acid ABC transporter ATP-binding protein [Ruminococcus sp. FC2018]|uniref:amino acid ABC transporter ATP-binding protein n=1 Tax=Ruminococcus sp. FC2018 TaxID=1410617 RepID=UPI00048BD419|nr:amino acid ABC transporter ATP-binding protein [Ruminococcus sp. FC2018]